MGRGKIGKKKVKGQNRIYIRGAKSGKKMVRAKKKMVDLYKWGAKSKKNKW